jgi:hypothetical protein
MATLAYTYYNYEYQTSSPIELIIEKNKFKCYEQLRNNIMRTFSDLFTIESFKEYEPANSKDFIDFVDFVNGELLEIEYVLICNFV